MVVRIYGLFLQDMRKTFKVELRKLMTEALRSQDQMSDVDTINQAKKQGYIASFDIKCRYTDTAPYSIFLWVKHVVTKLYGI